MIPPRQKEVKDEVKRFYVFAPASVQLELQKEALKRGTDLWTLCGSVLASWVAAGFPDSFQSTDPVSPCPSQSSLASPD